MLQQTHYFAPPRPPSPSFLRPDHSTHLAEYVSSLLPTPPPPRRRSRSTSPVPNARPPQRSQTAPLPPLQRSPSAPRSANPLPASHIPFPSLAPPRTSTSSRLRRAATDGASLVTDSPTPSSPKKPAFAALSRTPSSAFINASREGRVHPLTLQAVARRDSEQEALKLVKERAETERRRENSSDETAGGTAPSAGGAPPRLLRKESWTAAASRLGGAGLSESPTQAQFAESNREAGAAANGHGSTSPARRKKDLAGRGLGLVDEEAAQSSSRQRQDTGDTIVPPNSASTSSFRSASSATPAPASPSSVAFPPRSFSSFHPRSASASSSALAPSPSTASSSTASSAKRKSIFSRFSRSGRSISMSGTSLPPVAASPSASTQGPAVPTSPALSSFSEFGALPPSAAGEKARKKDLERAEEKVRFPKVKAKGKSTKDFNRLFLAQELFIPPPPSSSSTPPSSGFRHQNGDDASSTHSEAPSFHSRADDASGSQRKKKNAVWAVKFSEDGRYLAVGGKDGVVRVWEVLSTPASRSSALHPSSSPSPPSSPTDAIPSDSPSAARAPPSTSPSKKRSSCSPGSSSASASTRTPVSVMPVFASKPVREFVGHEADVLDLSWSKRTTTEVDDEGHVAQNNFLLSSSMDKTVRLWHMSKTECLCAFQHLDFVTSIAFHPKDDRFFLSGSLDCKLRLWNIPEKRVHIWTELPELITSVAFTRDGQLAIAGTFVGICMFFEVSTFRYASQFAAKSARGKNSKGKKVTSLCAFPLPSAMGDRLLVTTNDSRMRLYHTLDKVVETKYAGHENTSSQIRASFDDSGKYVISGSEDRNVYIWDSGLQEREDYPGAFGLHKKHKDGGAYECFPMSAHIVTAAIFAPTTTRSLLAAAGDPVFGDGRTHVAPLALAQTMSGGTSASSAGERLVPVKSAADGRLRLGGAEDAVIVVADDVTGIISIFRNSPLPSDPSLLGSTGGYAPSPSTGSGFTNGGEPASAGLARSGSKRWSRH
ncbi:hypothetical protein JCM10213v2_008808 [Rhodosporidiobolus nylandii]